MLVSLGFAVRGRQPPLATERGLRYGRRMAGRAKVERTTSYRTLAQLERAIVACERCPRLRDHCERVAREKKRAFLNQTYWGRPVPGFGDPRARLFIIGLAAAAHGGNRTGRVFTGDQSGSWLYEALHRFGFSNLPDSTGRDDGVVLTDCYISASARCAPPQNKPTREEIESCRPFLMAEMALLRDVRVIFTLGHIAHEAWLRASGWWERLTPGERPRFSHGGESRLPDGKILLSAYHPSRQNTNTGRLTREMWHDVFRMASALLMAR
jgi:uracil-DNA glycosylase family 4